MSNRVFGFQMAAYTFGEGTAIRRGGVLPRARHAERGETERGPGAAHGAAPPRPAQGQANTRDVDIVLKDEVKPDRRASRRGPGAETRRPQGPGAGTWDGARDVNG